jgi:F-type H+-transporting ATPase subunit gamma
LSETTASLRHQIDSATDLQSVVRTMKAMAASSIGQYENAVRALQDYDRTVQLALSACFRPGGPNEVSLAGGGQTGTAPTSAHRVAVVFGSDQGLVGQFNDVLANFVQDTLTPLSGPTTVWTVGERMRSRLEDGDWPLGQHFALPGSLAAITPLVGQVLVALEAHREKGGVDGEPRDDEESPDRGQHSTGKARPVTQVLLFHNQPLAGAAYAPGSQRLLPLDGTWQRELATMPWPTRQWPEVVNASPDTLLALVREYLFVSLFRACAQSLASENASRLAAMQRAEKNIDELLEGLNQGFHRLRQGSIDEELFDLVAGFEALSPPK